MSGLNGRPTAAELVAAVAEFRRATSGRPTTGSVNFHALVAANVLRTVQRELLDEDGDRPRAALTRLGYPDEGTPWPPPSGPATLDGRGDEVLACLREVVRHRLAIAHPGYDQAETGAP